MDLYAELKALLGALEDAQLPDAVCGALAVAIHGAPRATKDIDLMVPPEALPAVLEVARRCGYVFVAQPMKLSASGVSVTRVSKILDGYPLTLDLIHADEALAEPGRPACERASSMASSRW